MKTIAIVIGGFRQERSRPHGSRRLADRLREVVPAAYCEWNANFNAVARNLHKRFGGCGLRIIVAAYSWGAGHGVPKLCRALSRYHWRVERLILCDPIIHGPDWCWWLLMPLSVLCRFLGWPFHVHVPKNVDRCDVLFQQLDRPQGNPVVPSNGTVMHYERLDRPHTQMDDAEAYHNLVLEAVT